MRTPTLARSSESLRPATAVAAAALSLAFASPSLAVDFRVATAVYVGDDEKPATETLTIFKRGFVYDFPAGEQAVWTVMEPQQRRILLLRQDTQKMAVVSFDELRDLAESYRKLGVESGKKSIFDPQLAVTLEPESNRIVLQNDAMKYRVKALQPTDAAVADQYEKFADWFACLNVKYAKTFPPFGRMELNKELARRGVVPTEIEWTLLPQGRVLQTTVLRSTHDYRWTLSNNDEKSVERVQQQLVSFRAVTFAGLFPEEVAAVPAELKK